ncbi:MAG: helix-turn-helix domain-containing protein [Bacteriovoracaceae bacterium]|jgi:transcriptional regulator with XRE-family HTH domain|nr:helix-turn-helix domain-containing protein [Bacteriovoracaceae bacterium]
MSIRTGKLSTGKILKAFRNRFGLTQKEVAGAIGISISNLSALENDKRNIGAELAGRFSVIYGVRIERLLFPNGLKDIKGYKKLERLKKKLLEAA